MRSAPETRPGIDLAELIAWRDRCEKGAKDFQTAINHARNRMLRRLPVHDQAQVYGLIELLGAVQKPLQPPILGRLKLRPDDPVERLFGYQKRCLQIGAWAIAALAVYDQDVDALKNFARWALGAGAYWTYEIRGQRVRVEKLPVLSRALVENHLHGWRDWRQADDPLAWIGWMARKLAEREAWGDVPEIDTVPIDDIASTSAESADAGTTVERVYSFEGFKDEARRRGDFEVLAYSEGLESGLAQGLDKRAAHRQIRRQMGWNKFDAAKIRGRFEKLKDAAAGYVTHGVISDGSRTVYREPLLYGGLGHSAWTHKKPQRP